jgi:drug/metabolite transporter (DMT)-like permease
MIVVAMLLWVVVEGLGGLIIASVPLFEIVWLRYASHLVLLGVLFGPVLRRRLVTTGRPWLQIGRGLLMLGMSFCFVQTVGRLSLGDTMAGFWLCPLLIMLLGLRRANWRYDLVRLAIVGVAYGGVLIAVRPSPNLLSPAGLLALGMGLCFTFYLVLSQRLAGESLPVSLTYTGASVLSVLTIMGNAPSQWHGWLAIGVGLAVGLLGLIFLALIDRAVEWAPPIWLLPFTYSQPIWASLLEPLLIGHRPAWRGLAGSLVILLAAGLLLLWQRRSSPPADAAPVGDGRWLTPSPPA